MSILQKIWNNKWTNTRKQSDLSQDIDNMNAKDDEEFDDDIYPEHRSQKLNSIINDIRNSTSPLIGKNFQNNFLRQSSEICLETKSVANELKDEMKDFSIDEEEAENNRVVVDINTNTVWNNNVEAQISRFCNVLEGDEKTMRKVMNNYFYGGKSIQITLIFIGCISMILREQSNWNLISGAIVSTLTGLTNFIGFDKNFLNYQSKYESLKKLRTYIELQLIKPRIKRKDPSEVLEKVATARLKILEGT